ncbi:MAG: hypothetical protein ABJC79_08620 [Acidimicrobiia bacterium]
MTTAACGVVIVSAAIAVGADALAGGGTNRPTRIAVGSSPTVSDASSGVVAQIPDGWARIDRPLVPGLTDQKEVLTASTFSVPVTTTSDRTCNHQLPRSVIASMGPTDAFVWVIREVRLGSTLSVRPDHFDWSSGSPWPCPTDFPPGFRARWYSFSEHDHDYYAAAIAGSQATAERQVEAFGIRDSLGIAVSAPPSTAPSPSTTASTAPPVAAGDDAAVRAALLGWLDTQPRDAVRQYVEDFDAIRHAIEAGMAQHNAVDLGQFAGNVIDVHIVSATEATVHYDLLRGGVPLYRNLEGTVVKIGNRWKVSRATVCSLLALGGVQCPPG